MRLNNQNMKSNCGPFYTFCITLTQFTQTYTQLHYMYNIEKVLFTGKKLHMDSIGKKSVMEDCVVLLVTSS